MYLHRLHMYFLHMFYICYGFYICYMFIIYVLHFDHPKWLAFFFIYEVTRIIYKTMKVALFVYKYTFYL